MTVKVEFPINDIMGILDAAGNLVVQYKYDTFGKIQNISGQLSTTIGVINPYRYRSYRYDSETQLYYLNSRYYSPILGRFISPDFIDFLGEDGSLSYNLYTYCNNDFINLSDPMGNVPSITLNLLIRRLIHDRVGANVMAALQKRGYEAKVNVFVTRETKNKKTAWGFVDVLETKGNRFYEIKSYNSYLNNLGLIKDQLERYDASKNNGMKLKRGSQKFQDYFFMGVERFHIKPATIFCV